MSDDPATIQDAPATTQGPGAVSTSEASTRSASVSSNSGFSWGKLLQDGQETLNAFLERSPSPQQQQSQKTQQNPISPLGSPTSPEISVSRPPAARYEPAYRAHRRASSVHDDLSIDLNNTSIPTSGNSRFLGLPSGSSPLADLESPISTALGGSSYRSGDSPSPKSSESLTPKLIASVSPPSATIQQPKFNEIIYPEREQQSPNSKTDNSDRSRGKFSFRKRHSKKEIRSSLAAGEASIIQPSSINTLGSNTTAYSSLASVAEKDSRKDKAKEKEKDKEKEKMKEKAKERGKEKEKDKEKPKDKDDRETKSSLTDKLMEKIVATALPTASLNMADAEKRALHMKSNTPFNIPVMSRNFRNMTARTGVMYDAYYSAIRIGTWQTPSHTLSVLAIYTLFVLNPRLIPSAPFIFLLAYTMVPAYFYRHPSDPTFILPDPQSTKPADRKLLSIISPIDYQPNATNASQLNTKISSESQDEQPSSPNSIKPPYSSIISGGSYNPITSNAAATDVLIHYNSSPVIADGPPLADAIVPKPVPEISREFYMNVVDTQNAMDLYVQGYDSTLAILRRFAFFEGDEVTSCLVYMVLLFSAFAAYYLTPILVAMVPWKFVFLAGGWGAAIQSHPRFDQEKVFRPIKKELKKTREKGEKTLKKVVMNIKERQKKRRSDSSSSFSLDIFNLRNLNKSSASMDVEEVAIEDKNSEELGPKEGPDPDNISIDEFLGSDSDTQYDSDDSGVSTNSDLSDEEDSSSKSEKIPELKGDEDAYTKAKYYVKKTAKTLSNSAHLFNPLGPDFWDVVHQTAYTEFSYCDSLEQRTVEIFEFQFARSKLPKWATKKGDNGELEWDWDNWDVAKLEETDENSLKKTELKLKQIKSKRGVFTNWEQSLYANNSYLPRTRLGVIYTSTAQQNKLEAVLSTLLHKPLDYSSSEESDFEDSDFSDNGSVGLSEQRSSLETHDTSRVFSNSKRLKEAQKTALQASVIAGSNEPFVLPGFCSLTEVQPPPFWQYVQGANWKLDMGVEEWVQQRGIRIKEYLKAASDDDDDDDDDGIQISDDGKVLIDTREKWVYNTEPITYQSEREAAERVKKETKPAPEPEPLPAEPVIDKKTEKEKNMYESDEEDMPLLGGPLVSSKSKEKSKEREKKKPKGNEKAALESDIIWVRRRRWTRVCTRHPVVREVAK